MFISKKHISRRTVLRGMGAAVALPFLESMVPAQTPTARTAAGSTFRASFIYVPHGAIMNEWTPASDQTTLASKRILKPLEPYAGHLTLVTGLEADPAAPAPGDSGGDHSRSAAAFLSGVRAKKTAGQDVELGITADQVIAQRIGQDTVLPSLELGIEDVGYTGICGYGYSCVYLNTISWSTPTKPLPMEINPQVVFERLFGDGGTPEQRATRREEDRSILDAISGDVDRLRTTIGVPDRVRLDDYLDDVREIERRLQLGSNSGIDDVDMTAPVGVPQSFDAHVKLMYDLQVLAFQTDITRVSTMMYARDNSNRTYPDSGVVAPFHMASHHSNRPDGIETFTEINRYHMGLFAYFLERMRETPDGDGTLLDHSMILLGSTMSNGNEHDHFPLPAVIAGKAGGRIAGGRHIRVPDRTPLSNLLVGMMHAARIPVEKFGDSNGAVAL